MLRADPRTEVFRQAALFLGAGLLGIQVGAWILSSGGGFVAPPGLALGFVVGSILCAFRFRDRWLRAAFLVFAAQHLLFLMPMFPINQPASWLSGALLAAFAVLLVVAGARKRGPGMLAAAAAVFAAALVLKIVIARYAGTHSVMGLEVLVS